MKNFAILLVFVLIGCRESTPKDLEPDVSKVKPTATAVFDLINSKRVTNGLKPLLLNPALTGEADRYAKLMALKSTLSHTLDGSLRERIVRAGYKGSALGENIAYNYRSASAVVMGWMGSAGHKANILNGKYKDSGVGIAYSVKGEPYFCQIFGY